MNNETTDQALTASITTAREWSLGGMLRRSAARTPGALALIYRDRTWTYRELDEAVDAVAAAVHARGLARGERVALLSHNNANYLIITFALARLGIIAVPINFMLTADEVAYILDDSGAVGLVAEDALIEVAAEAIQRARTDVRVQAVMGQDVDGWENVEAWFTPLAPAPHVAVPDDAVLQLMYTSGTESRPKGAMMTSRSLLAQYMSCIVDGRFRRDDITLHALPMFHVAAQHCMFMPTAYLGGTNIVLDGPDPAAVLEAIETHQVTNFFAPPTVWISLLRHPDFDRRDLSSLRQAYYGASIMPVEIVRELGQRLPNVGLFNFYGQTEMSAVALVLPPEDQLRKPGSAGLPVLNSETRLVDLEGNDVPVGEQGEIVHRSPQATLGYWNNSEKTAEAFEGGWFHSGDLGVMDADGYISVVDRKKDMIKTGGENVASREVEEVIYTHPAVAEVAVVGVPHERWIEAVSAVVVARPGHTLDAEELRAWCRQRMAGYKTPQLVVVTSSLPKNASGKILKRALREQLTDSAAAT